MSFHFLFWKYCELFSCADILLQQLAHVFLFIWRLVFCWVICINIFGQDIHQLSVPKCCFIFEKLVYLKSVRELQENNWQAEFNHGPSVELPCFKPFLLQKHIFLANWGRKYILPNIFRFWQIYRASWLIPG